MEKDLSIRGETIQRVYNLYKSDKFIVNRRYQRKLVWTVDEKRDFIDSLSRGYPVPIILLAEVKTDKPYFEIIDGLQRLNAITATVHIPCLQVAALAGMLGRDDPFRAAAIRSRP